MAKGNAKKSKGQHRDDLERKRDERSRRNALKKEKQIKEYSDEDENFVSFKNQLGAIGYKIKDILGDGNCLFRALGDQLNGDQTSHHKHRKEVVKYMKDHRDDFEPFMEDDITFQKHLQLLSQLGVYGGNDSIVAFARNNGADVVIHQLNEPRWVIHGSEYSKTGHQIELHISYHNGEHYSSVRRITDPDNGPAWLYHNRQKIPNKGSTSGETHKKEIRKKEKWKDKESKTSEQSAGACGGTDPSPPEEIVMTATGCRDLPLVLQTLEENNYDVDLSIGYILQIMCLSQEHDDDTFGASFNDGEQNCGPSNINQDPCEEEEHNICTRDSDDHLIHTECNDQIAVNNIYTDSRGNSNDDLLQNVNNADANSKTSHNSEICDTNETEHKENAPSIVDNFRDSMTGKQENNSLNNKVHSGARPKQISKPKGVRSSSHLSNRQRKEQARLDKKKRREERRKEEINNQVTVEDGGTDSVATVTADLGAVSI